MRLRGPNNVKRAVQTDPTLLCQGALVNIRRKALGHVMIFTQGRTVQVLLLYRTKMIFQAGNHL